MATIQLSDRAIGKTFERWTVIGPSQYRVSPTNGKRVTYVECRCACGSVRHIRWQNLLSGQSKSCGCLRVEAGRRVAPLGAAHNTTHGHAAGGITSPEYSVWNAMRQRCTNPKIRQYSDYGGRGITVCERWLHSFTNFIADMGPRPSDGHSIDRIDNNGNYEPGNCRWATMSEQSRNKRRNRMIEFRGERLCAKDMAARYGIPYDVFRGRLRSGWSIESALLTPTEQRA